MFVRGHVEKVHIFEAYMVHWILKTPPTQKKFEKNISLFSLMRVR